jgi:hypothetical protein
MSDEQEPGGTVTKQQTETVVSNRAPKRDWTPVILAAVVLIGFFVVLQYLMGSEVPASSRDIVLQMVETLKNIAIMCVSYFVGTTAQGAKKTELIAKGGPVDPH